MSSGYWSSSTNANNTNNAWHVNFNNGNVNNNNKTNSYYVRAVRSGKCELLSFASVYQAYLDCRKRKRGTINALRFEFDLLENLTQLALHIQQGTYRPSSSVCFITTHPKLREIFAADFKDRIVHHLVVRELEKIWNPKFIYDSYASRKWKGIHAAARRLQHFMRRATRSMKRPAWYLQLDIHSFFMSIDKNILFAILERTMNRHDDKAKGQALLYLLQRIIFHDCTQDYRLKSDPAMLSRVPPHKSLFHNAPDKGLPIGNLTSQFLSNVYLNELDQYVKHTLKCRFYIRYVDDFVLIDENRDRLLEWRQAIELFLANRLTLKLKSAGVLRHLTDGADFLGYIIRPRYILSRRRVVNNLKMKLDHYQSKLVVPGAASDRTYCLFLMDSEEVTHLYQTISSYLGHFKHANTRNLLKSLWQRYGWLNEYFFWLNGRLRDRFKPTRVFRTLRLQLKFYRSRLGADVVMLVRIGKFYELFDSDVQKMASLLRLRSAGLRKGLLHAGFPFRMRDHYLEKILHSGSSVAIIEEKGPGRFVADRCVHSLFRFGGKPCVSCL